MAASLKLLPGSTVRWRGRRYLIVDYESLDAIIARQPGKRRLERIPVNEAAPDHASHIVSAWTPDLASVPEEAWQKAVKRFKILKPLLNMGNSERTFAHIQKAARALGKHPATVHRWVRNHGAPEPLSVFLRKERSDRGARRLSNKVEKIIDAAIKKIYLTAERPDVAAVVEEVNLQCFNSKIKGKPAPNTIRARVSFLSAWAGASARRNRSRRRAADQHRSSPFSSRLERNALVRGAGSSRLWGAAPNKETNIDLGLAGNARIVANAADPFDTPEQILIRERINCVNSLAHWQIITESEKNKEPRGRSRSQSYSQIALLHSHLFLHDQLTFADISGTDKCERLSPRFATGISNQ